MYKKTTAGKVTPAILSVWTGKKKSPEHERVNATNVPILKLQNTVRAGDVSARKERFLKGKYHIEIARSLSYTMHSVKTPPSTLDDLLTFLCAAERVSLWVLWVFARAFSSVPPRSPPGAGRARSVCRWWSGCTDSWRVQPGRPRRTKSRDWCSSGR